MERLLYRKPANPFSIPDRVCRRVVNNAKWVGECLECQYSKGSHGYAQIGWNESGARRATTAHRAAWTFYHGTQIPEGMTIDHSCKNRVCIAKDHLRLMTNYENARRTAGRDWNIGECAHGHSNVHLKEYERKDGEKRLHCSVCVESKGHSAFFLK